MFHGPCSPWIVVPDSCRFGAADHFAPRVGQGSIEIECLVTPMNFVRLTPEQRAAMDEDGFLVVRAALDRETVARAVHAVDRLAHAFLNKPVVHDRPEYNQLDLRPGLLRDESLRAMVASSPAVPLVVQLMGPNIHLHSTAIICKRPENPNLPAFRRGWHRDIRIARDLGNAGNPRVGIKICYCLTDFHSSRCGITLMARGTHLRNEPLAIPKGEVDPSGVEVCELQLDAGDALLFENRIFHTAAPNLSDRTSKVLMYGYAYRWMKQEVYLEGLDGELLEDADPIMRQLLGGYRDVDTPPWALQRWADRHGVPRKDVPWTVETTN
jgi:ectoine hydroxylase-related dioxygenase (phytanoyl-CoA dioxygenase family)